MAGIVKALFTVAGVIVGVILAGRFSDSLAGTLSFISSPGTAKVVAFAIILIVVMIIAVVLARLVKWAISYFDRSLLEKSTASILTFLFLILSKALIKSRVWTPIPRIE